MIRPCFNRLSRAVRIVFDGIAKPIPCEPPLREMIAVLMPITSPRKLIKGPPLFPGLIAECVRPIWSSLRTNDAVSHGFLKSEWITNGENKVPSLDHVGIRQLERFDAGIVDLEHGQIDLRIRAH